MKRYIMAVWGIVRAYQKRFIRDKTALFFTFAFPLIFLFAFGSIFSGGDINLKIAIINNAKSDFATRFIEQVSKSDVLNVTSGITDVAQAKQKMSRGEIDSFIELPANFGEPNEQRIPAGVMNVYYQKGAEQSGRTVAAIMQQVLDGINKQLGRPDATLTVAEKSTDSQGLTSFDYTFSGLLGFAIMSMGIFGLANAMPQEKQRGSFRRLRASPFRASQLILANGVHYLIITLMSVLAMVIASLTIFHFNMRGNWITFAIFAAYAAIMILGFGLFIGAWARNENQSAPLSNLVSFPMMFLSGVFFPRFLYPEWLQGVTQFVPLTPVVDGLRRIMTENAALTQLGPELAIIGAWTLIIYVAATKCFRWD